MAVASEDISKNRSKKLLVVGKTGTGKSSLCNRIVGLPHDADLFPVSAAAESCTQTTSFADFIFKETFVSLIDTVGFDDAKNDSDVKIIQELVQKLQTKCDKVHQFVVAINGQNPRLDKSLKATIKVFQDMFSEAFWDRCVIVFTRIPMDTKSIKKRQRSNGGQTDDEWAGAYIKVVQEQFLKAKGKNLQYLFLDACYDEDDDEEKKAFNESWEKLHQMLDGHDTGLPTSAFVEAETEDSILKKAVEEQQIRLRNVELNESQSVQANGSPRQEKKGGMSLLKGMQYTAAAAGIVTPAYKIFGTSTGKTDTTPVGKASTGPDAVKHGETIKTDSSVQDSTKMAKGNGQNQEDFEIQFDNNLDGLDGADFTLE